MSGVDYPTMGFVCLIAGISNILYVIYCLRKKTIRAGLVYLFERIRFNEEPDRFMGHIIMNLALSIMLIVFGIGFFIFK